MMKAETKQKWVEALRSGKYKQAESELKSVNGFCCLGVLHEVTKGTWTENDYSKFVCGTKHTKNGSSTTLEGPFLQGLHPAIANDLAGFNDSRFSFNYIADYIEENVVTK